MRTDGATPIPEDRLDSVLASTASNTKDGERSLCLQRFRHHCLPTLSHLLALILHPTQSFPPQDTSLFVIDNLNTLLDIDYPRFPLNPSSTTTANAKWASSRRYAVLGAIGGALNKLAIMANLAIVVTTGCATRNRDDRAGLALVPGVGGGDEWETAIGARVVMFRDFHGRFVGVIKRRGRFCGPRAGETGDVGLVSGFSIDSHGSLRDIQTGQATAKLGNMPSIAAESIPQPPQIKDRVSSPVKGRKRIHDEIADSDEEEVDEYGWDDGVEDAIAAEGLGDDDLKDDNQEGALSNVVVID